MNWTVCASPSFPAGYSVYRPWGYAEPPSDLVVPFPLLREIAYCSHVFVSQLGRSVFLACRRCTMRPFVLFVTAMSIPSQVFNAVVLSISVVVTRLVTFGAWTDKRLKNKSVNIKSPALAVATQADSRTAVFSHEDGDKDAREFASFFWVKSYGPATNLPVIADFIILVSWNHFPCLSVFAEFCSGFVRGMIHLSLVLSRLSAMPRECFSTRRGFSFPWTSIIARMFRLEYFQPAFSCRGSGGEYDDLDDF